MCVCVCVCVCEYIYIYIYIYVFIKHAYIYAYTHTAVFRVCLNLNTENKQISNALEYTICKYSMDKAMF